MKVLIILFVCALLLISYSMAAPITDSYPYSSEELAPDDLGDNESRNRDPRSENISYEQNGEVTDELANNAQPPISSINQLIEDFDSRQLDNQEYFDPFYSAGQFLILPLLNFLGLN